MGQCGTKGSACSEHVTDLHARLRADAMLGALRSATAASRGLGPKAVSRAFNMQDFGTIGAGEALSAVGYSPPISGLKHGIGAKWLAHPKKAASPDGHGTVESIAGAFAGAMSPVSGRAEWTGPDDTPNMVLRYDPTVVVGSPKDAVFAGRTLDRFAVPSRYWESSCPVNEVDCSEFAPNVNATRDTTICHDDTLTELIVTHACGWKVEAMVTGAWCLLLENYDILQWASCLVYGKAYRSDLVMKMMGWDVNAGVLLSSLWFRVELTCDTESNCGAELDAVMTAAIDWFGGNITACTTSDTIQTWKAMWESGTPGERLCVLMDVAGVLAHELTHIVYPSRSDDSGRTIEGCWDSYRFGNLVMWALLKRYSDAADSTCCRYHFDEALTSPDAIFASNFPSHLRFPCG